MKSQYVVLSVLAVVVAGLVAAVSLAESARQAPRAKDMFPNRGISLGEMNEILTLLGNEDLKGGILSVRVNKSSVEVRTGHVEAPLAGSGMIFTLEKKDGKWVITKRSAWVS